MIEVLIFAVIAVLVFEMRRPAGYLTFPAVFAILYVVWIMPQLVAVGRDDLVPVAGLNGLILMALLCLLAVFVGWHLRLSPNQPAMADLGHDINRLIVPVIGISLFSIAVNVLLSSYRIEYADISQWTGTGTIVAFFAQLRDLALAGSLLIALRRPTVLSVAILAANAAISLPVAFVFLRRAEMIGLALTVAGAYWFSRRRTVPLPALAVVALALTVVVYVVGPLRGAAARIEYLTGSRPSLLSSELWSQINVVDAANNSLDNAPDVRNSAYIIDYRLSTGEYGYGAVTWNQFIRQWVPGQIIGADVKADLQLEFGGAIYDEIFEETGYRYQKGTTSTGFGSAFSDFGYFGALYFLVISTYLKRLFDRSHRGDAFAQMLFLSMLPIGLLSLTHGHGRFYVSLPLFWIVVKSLQVMGPRKLMIGGWALGVRGFRKNLNAGGGVEP